jgi:tetratricopeptide (TPR) repeat protein
MIFRNRHDVPLAASFRSSIDAYDRAVELFHGYYGDPLAILDVALEADPAFAMGHLAKAGMLLTSTEKPAEAVARGHIDAAAACIEQHDAHAWHHLAAARAWLAGDWQRAAESWGDAAVEAPGDVLALQLAHLTDFYLGHSTMLRDRPARALPYWREDIPGYNYLLGMYAFGLEECGDYPSAERAGRHAVEIHARDPWAIHAVAHVMEMQGRIAEGIRWLESRIDDWSPENALAVHNWWHLALYYLDLGEHAKVLELYDTRVRPGDSRVVLEMIDASAMLWRLHLRGIDVGARWSELVNAWAPLVDDAHYAFNDVHAMMAFIGAGRGDLQRKLLRAMTKRVFGEGTNAAMTRDVGLPVANALIAFDRGDYGSVVESLRSVRPLASRFGGSHAQRDLLNLTLIEAAFHSGRAKIARALAAERTHLKPSSPFNWRLTARAQSALGDERKAAYSRAWSRTVAAAAAARMDPPLVQGV